MHEGRDAPHDGFARFAADRLLRDRDRIARAWLDRLEQRISVRPRRVLPTRELLDHAPRVLEAAAACIRAGETAGITADPRVLDDLARVARLRRRQGYDPQEVIAEFGVLSRVLTDAAAEWIGECPAAPDPRALGHVFAELARIPLHMGEVAVGIYGEQEAEGRHHDARRVREFLDALAHQVKTPLGAAEGAAQLLEEDAAGAPERLRLVGVVGRGLARLRAAVTDVLALADAEIGASGEGPAVSLPHVLAEVLREVGPAADAAGVRIRVDEAPPLRVDGPRVELVLLNLVSNAVKYADPARPDRWVRVEFTRTGEDGWQAAVRDNGLGIPRELHGRVFDRFFRAHPDRAEGTGLGLAIAREAARQLGTRLRLESEPGEGTTFCFALPPASRPDAGGEARATPGG